MTKFKKLENYNVRCINIYFMFGKLLYCRLEEPQIDCLNLGHLKKQILSNFCLNTRFYSFNYTSAGAPLLHGKVCWRVNTVLKARSCWACCVSLEVGCSFQQFAEVILYSLQFSLIKYTFIQDHICLIHSFIHLFKHRKRERRRIKQAQAQA